MATTHMGEMRRHCGMLLPWQLTEVWNDARSATTSLTRKVDEGTPTLLHDIGESVSAVGNRIDTIPIVATYSPDGPTPRPAAFTGSGDDATQFSLWLRHLEDVMRLRAAVATSQQKADFLICYLEGVAREKVELSQQERCDFNAIVAHLKQAFERRSLSVC
ncbi:hypothetical protein RB195_001197 [Necator americanus]|uniref:Uncharacterized protein n=1 Tax=Necator americanus TaxID=51031 RepID=A0ABR1DD38_NECAM